MLREKHAEGASGESFSSLKWDTMKQSSLLSHWIFLRKDVVPGGSQAVP